MQVVSRIGHVALRVPDLAEAVDFAVGVLGLRETERTDGVSYLTCNERHHEHILIEDDVPGCDHIALEAPSVDALAEVRDRLIAEGCQILSESPEERGIAEAIRFLGPGDEVFEAFAGIEHRGSSSYETFTARPRKLGHVTLTTEQPRTTAEFLSRVLDFRVSDQMQESFWWLRCNTDHHGIGLIEGKNGLHHYAFELDDWAALKQSGDHLITHNRTFAWGPGRHGPGDNLFAYFLDPNETIVELFAELVQIEDEYAYSPRNWPEVPTTVNQWGPAPPDGFLELSTAHAAARSVSA
jgi:catechol 2,3-dioxygenase